MSSPAQGYAIPRWLAWCAAAEFMDRVRLATKKQPTICEDQLPFLKLTIATVDECQKTSYVQVVIMRMLLESGQRSNADSPPQADRASNRSQDILGAIKKHISPAAGKLCVERVKIGGLAYRHTQCLTWPPSRRR